ncbi:formate/nitrite transporter family protein [Roseomonas sp. HF4]|uniref:formate/nitrite transporter family protein n=1 Tax=Roseomonas sp. HF4 TaxID=2562313 RepID=UPI0010C0AA0F|nr:formate/nitrite transporter family protein [Roseomonas sp. HF4]
MPDTRPGALAGIEGRLPPEIAAKAEADGVAKAGQDGVTLLTLGVLGGAFIAFGAIFANVALTGAEAAMPFGMARVVAGFVFALGISMVLLGGAQIFTRYVLMVMAWASGRLALPRVLRAWALVWIGNLAGAVGTALLVFLAQHHLFGGGQVGVTALRTAQAKATLPFAQAFLLGMLCNTLVCMAVWLSLSSRPPAHRMMVIMLPIAAFVAAGFEHAVANMYFIPFGLLIKTGAAEGFWQAAQLDPAAFRTLDMAGAARNLAAVTLGNITGGALLVAGAYWLLYRRGRPAGSA